MSKELVISSNRHETKVAVLEEDQLVEVYFQRSNEYSLAGSIHKGRVTRVLPGMQSAFVDLGLERDTFLYVSDFLEDHEEFESAAEERTVRESRGREERRERAREERGRGEHRRGQARPQGEGVAAEIPPAESATGEAAAKGAAEALASSAEGAATPAAAAVGEQARDRRGRRRRRRRGGRGFPESKYGAPPSAEGIGAVAEATEEGEEEGEPEGIEAHRAEAGEESISIVLPGESLRKYRGVAEERHVPVEAHPAPEAPSEGESVAEAEAAEAEDRIENPYDEPIHYPPENALPDAPIHEVIEREPEAAPVAEAESAEGGAEPPVASELPSEESHAAAGEEEEEGDIAPAVAPLLDEDEDLDIQAMILGDVEGIEIEAAGGAAAEGVPGEAGVAEGQPESGSAEVRERGGRFPHRVSRRSRRRRGGDRGGEARAQESRGQEGPGEGQRPPGPGRGERTVSRPNIQQVSISDLLKEGQEIIVQIAKEPLGQKGARITSHIALPGRYVVYMPTLEHMGVSRKIASEEERHRLKRTLQAQRPGPVGGFITRTAAAGRTEQEIAADMQFLYTLWQDIKAKSEKCPAPVLLHHDLDIVQRILRDQLTDDFKAIWIDNEVAYEGVLRFIERFQPALVGKVKLYTREIPIFDAFNITNELEKALRPKVWLKSGGFIVINQTEALVAIDVNTGKYVGKTNRLEDTIVKTNTEAIKEIVRQVRLRDLGGIIVIDFIDMDERKNRQKVMQALEEAMRVDRAPYKILQFNDFGLVAITRKRVKQSLERTLCSPCPHCEGAGYIKSVQTVVSEILAEARKMAKSVEGKDVMLRVHPDVAKVLKSHQNKFLEELEEVLRRPVLVKGDPQLHHEKFDLA
jgi:ribonuclease G